MAGTFDPTDPTTWPATYDGGRRVGETLMKEFAEIIERFVQQRLQPAMQWAASHGGDPTIVLRAFATTLRESADAVEGRGGR